MGRLALPWQGASLGDTFPAHTCSGWAFLGLLTSPGTAEWIHPLREVGPIESSIPCLLSQQSGWKSSWIASQQVALETLRAGFAGPQLCKFWPTGLAFHGNSLRWLLLFLSVMGLRDLPPGFLSLS